MTQQKTPLQTLIERLGNAKQIDDSDYATGLIEGIKNAILVAEQLLPLEKKRDTEVEQLRGVIAEFLRLRDKRDFLFTMDAKNDFDLIEQQSNIIAREEEAIQAKAKQILEEK